MRYLFVGGPGRSGTSFVADRLGRHPGIAALKDIELKIFCEKNGLLDLFHALVETYSPNRAIIARDQFRRLAEALIDGRHGQPPLASAAPAVPAEAWRAAFAAFTEALAEDDHPLPQTPERYFTAARALLARIAALAAAPGGGGAPPEDTMFLEKTPHNLLAIGFLAQLAPGACFLHVMRDPRSVAWSLLRVRWGPDSLAGAARWVEGYCHAWTVAEARAASLGLPLLRLHIEDVATAPDAAAAWLAARLDLAPRPDLFRGADATVLNGWAAQAGASDRALLDARLGGWAARFGYATGQVGQRPATPFACPPPGPDDAPQDTAQGAPAPG